MEERLRILKLLEDGKIDAEEAARLLEAVRKEPRGEREGSLGGIVSETMDSVGSVLATIPGIVKAGLSVGVGEGKRSIEASPKERVVIKSVGGDLEVELSKDRIQGEVESGVLNSLGSEKQLVLKTLGGDATFRIPPVSELQISSLGGDLSGTTAARVLSVNLMGGDVQLSLKDLDTATIKTNSGDIELTIPEDSNLSLDLQTNWGEVRCDLPLTQEERGESFLRGVVNEPKGELHARTLSGDIIVRKKEG